MQSPVSNVVYTWLASPFRHNTGVPYRIVRVQAEEQKQMTLLELMMNDMPSLSRHTKQQLRKSFRRRARKYSPLVYTSHVHCLHGLAVIALNCPEMFSLTHCSFR